MLFLFMVFFTLADVAEAADNSIKPDQTNVFSTEGSNISLSCKYTGSVYSLHWYRQKPGSRPEFLLLIHEATETVTKAQPPYPRLSIKLKKEQDKTKHKTLQQIVKTTENIIRVSLTSNKDPYQKVYIYKAVSFVNITSPFYQTLYSPANWQNE
ncbi:hypothetical protein QTP86_004037 [Hemibagrus guttatus]|nr:hypothetical protein QTP86_004037 [Hemibagrus guttatus]